MLNLPSIEFKVKDSFSNANFKHSSSGEASISVVLARSNSEGDVSYEYSKVILDDLYFLVKCGFISKSDKNVCDYIICNDTIKNENEILRIVNLYQNTKFAKLNTTQITNVLKFFAELVMIDIENFEIVPLLKKINLNSNTENISFSLHSDFEDFFKIHNLNLKFTKLN